MKGLHRPICPRSASGQAVQSKAVVRCGEETYRAKFMISDYVSRNANEPSKASLHNLIVTKLPELLKSGTCMEAMTVSTCKAIRCKMGWRA